MKTVNQIFSEVIENQNMYGWSYVKEGRTIEIKSFWGYYDEHKKLVNSLRNNGYTVFE